MPTATVRQRRVAASDDRSGTPPNFELHGGGVLRPQSSILALRGAKAPWRRRWLSAKNSGRRGFWGAISDGKGSRFFVEERPHPFLRHSPLKFGEGFVVARK